ncbi:MAG: PDZ domain-containing protein [Candidatus Aminicenantes bacterium]|nr:PDZ domain-containing protein [Candidatus Aminicenantes bacterium]NIM78085.1 PDZ domain-containing protein [Candidatus Aminicenantes bacterium]NIN17403.1 PDZ domain-containing protein [Candidatus Aminicenantes bacterium]NIN41299.1 PDZ domain-containing protein [Candidatus Aminicenantes bacterium]NIN84069.1 PDZ domain-containing protein [Candidatus Aminicenantes bacterium]
MKKVILILLLIMILFFTESMVANAIEHVFATGRIGIGDSPGTERDTKGILNTVSPSIVKVIAQSRKPCFASGIAIDRRHVISNAVVARYPYQRMVVKTVNKKTYPAKLVGKDPNSSIILLKINRAVLTPIKPAASYEVGDWTALVGVFYKEFPAIFQGIVSSVSDEKLILNAPVMPGASGGAVIDQNGRVMGVIRGPIGFAFGPDYIYSDHSWEFLIQNPRVRYKDLCCAVPVQKVMRIADDLKKYGKVRRGWLGVDLMQLTPELAKAFKVKEGAGLMISKLQKDTAAEAAGLQVADIIVKAGKKTIRKNADLRRVLGEIRDNESMDIVVYRDGNIKTFSVVPDKRGRFGMMMDQFLKQTREMWTRINEENRLQRENWEQRRQARQKAYGNYVRDAELMKKKTSENYFKAEIEKMRKKLEKMSKEIQQLKKQLKKKEKNNASTTTI